MAHSELYLVVHVHHAFHGVLQAEKPLFFSLFSIICFLGAHPLAALQFSNHEYHTDLGVLYAKLCTFCALPPQKRLPKASLMGTSPAEHVCHALFSVS